MKSLRISEQNGLYVVETSSGVRASGASLESALEKIVPANLTGAFGARFNDFPDRWIGVRVVFDSIPSAAGGQIARGQASA